MVDVLITDKRGHTKRDVVKGTDVSNQTTKKWPQLPVQRVQRKRNGYKSGGKLLPMTFAMMKIAEHGMRKTTILH